MASIFGIDIEALRKATTEAKHKILAERYGASIKASVDKSVSRGWNAADVIVDEDDASAVIGALHADGFAVTWNPAVPHLVAFSW